MLLRAPPTKGCYTSSNPFSGGLAPSLKGGGTIPFCISWTADGKESGHLKPRVAWGRNRSHPGKGSPRHGAQFGLNNAALSVPGTSVPIKPGILGHRVTFLGACFTRESRLFLALSRHRRCGIPGALTMVRSVSPCFPLPPRARSNPSPHKVPSGVVFPCGTVRGPDWPRPSR